VPADLTARATASQVGSLGNAGANGSWSEATLNGAGRSAIHKSGRTQFRVGFTLGANGDSAADYMGWYSGDNAISANRPQLVVVYQ
jgi:hypothetical protein